MKAFEYMGFTHGKAKLVALEFNASITCWPNTVAHRRLVKLALKSSRIVVIARILPSVHSFQEPKICNHVPVYERLIYAKNLDGLTAASRLRHWPNFLPLPSFQDAPNILYANLHTAINSLTHSAPTQGGTAKDEQIFSLIMSNSLTSS